MAHTTKLDLDPELEKRVQQLARLDADVLITGPSGSGKSALAKRIHDLSPRRGSPFIPQNCGAIPKGLEESTLFGHERGAFTSALQAADGIVAAADRGTLFLDEIADLSLPAQVKLLTLLQEHTYRRVGSTVERHASFRLIAATNKDLLELCNQGRFRDDLYHRINVLPISLRPLRGAPEQAERIAAATVETLSMSSDLAGEVLAAVKRLSRHPAAWPGNIRELNTFVKRCALGVEEAERWILGEWARWRTSESAERLTAFAPSVSPSMADRERYAGMIQELAGRGARPKAAVSRKGSLELAGRLLDVFPEPLSMEDVQEVLGARDRRTLQANIELLVRHGLVVQTSTGGVKAAWPPATSAVLGCREGAWIAAGPGQILSLNEGDRVRVELTSRLAGLLGVLLVTHGPKGASAPHVLLEGHALIASKTKVVEFKLDDTGWIEQVLVHVGPSSRRGGSLVEPMIAEGILPDSTALERGRRFALDRWHEGWISEHLVFHTRRT